MASPDFANILDDRLLNTVELMGILKRNSETDSLGLATEWFKNPPSQLQEMFGSGKRDVFRRFITDLLGSSTSWLEGGDTSAENETWHAIPDSTGKPTGLYLVLTEKEDNVLVFGLGGTYRTMVPEQNSTIAIKCSGSLPVAKVDGAGNWSMALHDGTEPTRFSLRIGAVSGDGLVDNQVVHLGGLGVFVTITQTGFTADVILEQLQLPGENSPRDRTLQELGDSFGIDFVLDMLMDHLPVEVSNPLRILLGLGSEQGFPQLDFARLFAGDGHVLGDWFTRLRSEGKLGGWLGELGHLCGLNGSITGTGTRRDPFRLDLGLDASSLDASLTLAVEGDVATAVYPGFECTMPAFVADEYALGWTLRSELIGVDVQTGNCRFLPTLRLSGELTRVDGTDLIPANTQLTLPGPAGGENLALAVQVRSVAGGLVYENGQSLRGFIELYDVGIADRHWDVMDLNSMEQGFDVALDAAQTALLAELRKCIGISANGSLAASRIGALFGLNKPVSCQTWNVDLISDAGYLGLFLNDPLRSVALYHSRAIASQDYRYLMQDLLHLLRGETATLAGQGSETDPWRIDLFGTPADAKTVALEVVQAVQPRPRLQCAIRARLTTTLADGADDDLKMDAEIQATVLTMTLPENEADSQGTTADWLSSATIRLGFGVLPEIAMAGLTIGAEKLTGSVSWEHASGFAYDLALKGLRADYTPGASGDGRSFTWNSLSLPQLTCSGDGAGWSFGPEIEEFGHLLLRMFGQWLTYTSPQGFALAGLLGLLPDLDELRLPDYPAWNTSPWHLPGDWPVFQFEQGHWHELFSDPWQAVKAHIVKLLSTPRFAIPALRWLGGFFCDCLPDLTRLTLPDGSLDWDLGRDDTQGGKRFPTLAELPFTIKGGGTYPNPFRLQVRDGDSKWHNGALLVWFDPDGLPTLDIRSMAQICVPRLDAELSGSVADLLAGLAFPELLDVIGFMQTADPKIGEHLAGYGSEMADCLAALQDWLVASDGFGQLSAPVENEVNGRLRNVQDVDLLPKVSHGQQLSAFASELHNFVTDHAEDTSHPHLVLVGDESTDPAQWDGLLGLLGVSADQHSFCLYGVAPDQQELSFNTADQATIVTLSSVNTDPETFHDGQFSRLPLDRLGDHTPAKQLQRVLDRVEAEGSNKKIVLICHGGAGFAARALLQDMDSAADVTRRVAGRIAAVCTVGMPEIRDGLLPGILTENCQQGLDFLLGLLQEGGEVLHPSISESLDQLDSLCGVTHHYGFGDVLKSHLVPELTADLVARVQSLPDSFAGVPCQGFYSRLAVAVEDGVTDFSFKSLLCRWLEQKMTLVASGAEPTHVGFGLSWQETRRLDDADRGDLLVVSETRADIFRVALAGGGDENLQSLPRFRTEVTVRRDGGWLVGQRNRPVRCRYATFSLDLFNATCRPDVVFHDAGIDRTAVERIGIEFAQDVLWTAEHRVRILLDQFCEELPVVHEPLSCFFVATGLFVATDGRLMPHADSWQALLTDPTVFMQAAIPRAVADPTKREALRCCLQELLGLHQVPVVKELLVYVSGCPEGPDEKIIVILLQVFGLMRPDTCLPVVENWLKLLQNPKVYLSGAWQGFMANTPEAQAHRIVVAAEVGAEYARISPATPMPPWLSDLSFDGNKLTCTLGGSGFVVAGGHGCGSVQLRVPVEVDFINGHVFIRCEVDISGMLGVHSPLGSAEVFGGAALFFQLTMSTLHNPHYSCGISFDGQVEMNLADGDEWQQVFGRLVTQGLGSRFMAEIDTFLDHPEVRGLIRCLAGGRRDEPLTARGLSLPGSLADWQKIITPERVGCVLDSAGSVLDVLTDRDGVPVWAFAGFYFTYPHAGVDYNFAIQTSDTLRLYEASADQVKLDCGLSFGFSSVGSVTLVGHCTIDTTFSDVQVALATRYNLQDGVHCTLTSSGLVVDILPFSGFDSILSGTCGVLIDTLLPGLLDYLRTQCGAGSLSRKLFRLLAVVAGEIGVLRSNFKGWLQGRLLALSEPIPAELREPSEAAGLEYFEAVFTSSCIVLANGVVTYYIAQNGSVCPDNPMLTLQVGNGVGPRSGSSDFGLLAQFTPATFKNNGTDIVDLMVIAGCWISGTRVHGRGDVKLQMAEGLLSLGNQSLRPEFVFNSDSTGTLELYLASSSEPQPLLKVVILSPLGVELHLADAASRIIIPLLEEVVNLGKVKAWLGQTLIGNSTAGDIFESLGLLNPAGSGLYTITTDLGAEWSDGTSALTHILHTLLTLAEGATLLEFDGGTISLASDDGWYGLRVSHPGITVLKDPEIKLVLGEKTDWVNGCGIAGAAPDATAGAAGLSIFILRSDNGTFSPGCRILLGDVGLDFQGKGNSKLFDFGFTSAKGISLRSYIDLVLEPSVSVKWAVQLQALQLGIPLGASSGGDNPVAGSLLASPAGDPEPVSPAIDFRIAFGQKRDVFLGDASAADGVAWMNISKQLGPVYIKSLGIKLDDLDLSILVDGKVELMGLQVEVDDLSVTFPLDDFFNLDTWQLDCKGIGVRYKQGGLCISGALLKVDDPTRGLEYRGVCTIETSGTTFTALGAYSQLGDDPSLFVFMVFNMEIGGPPMFYIRGLAGGLGYNRGLHVPQVEGMDDFILLDAMQGDGVASDPLALLERDDMSTSFPAQRGSYWFGLGVKFSTFEIFQSVGFLYLLLDNGVEMGLLGCTTLKMPEDAPIVHLVMNFKARYSSKEGSFEALAQLTDDSWLFDPSCRLQGGFALKSWFSGSHRGDFVITLGGYHSKYKKPDHYPDVPRIGFVWQVNSETSIKGTSYFALTSNAVMAGGELDASYHSGNLKAWFRVWAHFLMQWKPFLYDVQIGMSIGASYKMSVKIPFVGRVTKTFKIELGGDLHVWGPDFAGTATLNWWVISFTVGFGASGDVPADKALTWSEFAREFLPSEDGKRQYWQIHAAKGLLEERQDGWLMKAECTLRTESVFPSTEICLGSSVFAPDEVTELDIRPMHETDIRSSHEIDIKKDGTSIFAEWEKVDDSPTLYQKCEQTITRMSLTFDRQEVAKALWEFDDGADPLESGTPLVGTMGVSLRFFIDNKSVLNNLDGIRLDQNDRSDCIMPLPFNHELRPVLPGKFNLDWLHALNLDLADQEAFVVALYSAKWHELRLKSLQEMRSAGALIPAEKELARSRIHHLAERKGMPTVGSVYLGVDLEEDSTRVRLPRPAKPGPATGLGWRLAIIVLPQREVQTVRKVRTTIARITGLDDVRRVNLDQVLTGLATGRVLRKGVSRLGGVQQSAQAGRVIVGRSRACGQTQKLLQEQLYNGLDKAQDGSVLNPGMVHVWQSQEDVGEGCRVHLKGEQVIRLSCFSRSGVVLLDYEAVGNVKKTLPATTRRLVVTGLGAGSEVEVKSGRVERVKAESVGAGFSCGWSSSDILPRISGSVLLCTGAVLQSYEYAAQKRHTVGLTNVAEFLHRRTSCTTIFTSDIKCVGVMLSREDGATQLDDDIEITMPNVVIAGAKVVSCGKGILCLYELKGAEESRRGQFKVTVRGQNGWLLHGVYGGMRDLEDLAATYAASLSQPVVSQDVVAGGGTTRVSIFQTGLHEKLQSHRQRIKERGVRRQAVARVWKGEKTKW